MKELGKKIGVSESAISQYETRKRQPDNETLIKIADVLGVSSDYLLGLSSQKEKHSMKLKNIAKEWKSDKMGRLFMRIDTSLLDDLEMIAKVDNMSLEDKIEEILYWAVENRYEEFANEENSRMMQEWYESHHTGTTDTAPAYDTIRQDEIPTERHETSPIDTAPDLAAKVAALEQQNQDLAAQIAAYQKRRRAVQGRGPVCRVIDMGPWLSAQKKAPGGEPEALEK